MTLVDVSHQVLARRHGEREARSKARQWVGQELVRCGKGGALERDLVVSIVDRFHLDPDVAYSIVDSLRSAGLTTKNWETGVVAAHADGIERMLASSKHD